MKKQRIGGILISDMTVAAQKQIVQKALALPKKARARLAGKLLKSLEEPETKISRKEWNQAWKTELDKRLEEMRSGKVKGISLEEARKGWNKILGRA